MAVINEAKRAKAHKLLKNTDPELNPMDYNASMMRVTNFLNVTYTAKDRMEWIRTHYPKAKFGEHSDLDFKSLATLCRLKDNGNALSDAHEQLMKSEFERLQVVSKRKVAEPKLAAAPVQSIQDKMDEKVNSFLGEFAGLVDEYTTNKTIPKVDQLIKSMGIRGPMVNKVLNRVARTTQELRDAIDATDKQLVEGYSNFKKVELKKLLSIYESLISALGQAKVTTVRKARVVKSKPPVVVAKWVKFCKEDKETGFKSVEPFKAIGASEVWTYHVTARKLTCYKAVAGQELTFKGTSILNFDTEKSVIKTVRKPEEMKKLVGAGTRPWNAYMKSLTTKPGTVKGRFGDETLIMAVMK
jgi:hypothetical protein